jgi:hypothetical protein
MDHLDRRERLKARALQGVKAMKLKKSSSSLEEEVSGAIDKYLSQGFNPVEELKAQLKRKGKDWKKEDIDWDKVEDSLEILYTSKHFDVAEWWANEGKKIHPLLAIAIAPILSLPASNGHQERTFSTCQHFNDELRQRLKVERFEMSVLLAVNKEYAGIKIPTEEEAIAFVADVISGIEEEMESGDKDERERILELEGLDGLENETFQEDQHETSANITPRRLPF